MTVGQKASLSLLIAVILFAGFAVAAFSGLFDVIESSFHNPSVTRGIETSLSSIAEAADRYHELNLERFASVLERDAVRRSFLPNTSAEDAFDRSNTMGKLQEETAGLAGIRFIDANGKRIHFSTIAGDVLRKTATEIAYRNYGDGNVLPFAAISTPEGSAGRIVLDPGTGRFAYSLPFVDGFGVYRGSAIFYVSADGLIGVLVKDGLVAVGELAVAAGDGGIVLKMPAALRVELSTRIAELWKDRLDEKPLTIAAENGGKDSFVLFSKRTELAGYIGRIVPASAFLLPPSLKWLLLSSFFVTAYLSAFLILNIRQDRMAVLGDRIKRFQIVLLEEYFEKKTDLDFGRWRRELEARRADVREAIHKSVGKIDKKQLPEIDELIDKSWDEILSVLGGRAEAEKGGPSLKEIERLLAEALKNGSFVLPAGSVVQTGLPLAASAIAAPARAPKATRAPAPPTAAPAVVRAKIAEAAEEAEEVEEVEELEAAEEVEELEELESSDVIAPAELAAEAEEVEELEAAEEVEELEAAEEVEELEAAEEVEELEAAEEVEELEAAEEVEELEAAEEVEELEAAEEVEEVEELEAAEEVEEVEEVEELEAAEEVEELEAAEEVEELEAAEEIEELGAAEEAAPADLVEEAEEVEELEAAEEVEELEAAEEVEELEELEAVEETGFAGDEAYRLSASQHEDIPTIPESTGLELPDEMDIADLIGFIDLEEATAVEPLEAEGYDNEPTAYSTKRQRLLDGPEYIFDGFESAATEGFGDSGAEPEIELDLSTIDLSSLDQWEGSASPESAAFAEQPRVVATIGDDGEESPEFIFQPVFIRSQSQYEAEEADDSAIENGEIPMLSMEMREFLEYLPAFEEEEDLSEPVELTEYLGPYQSYSPLRYLYAPIMKVQSELPVVGEGESWTEAEFLEDSDEPEIAFPESEAEFDEAELESLDSNGFVVFRDGVFRVNEEYSGTPFPVLDPSLRELVDSVLGAPRA